MSTFYQWLDEQRESEGPSGEIARWWAGEAAVRPRASTPSGVQKWLDRQLREGSLASLEQDAKGRMREQFADTVREYHDRDKPEAAKLDADGTLKAFMAETREALRMLRVRTDQIAARLGVDTPYGERTDPLVTEIPVSAGSVVDVPPGGAVVTPATAAGHRAALEIRARLGDEAAAAELAAASPQAAPGGLEAAPAYGGDPLGAGEALSDDLGAGPELSPEDWDLLWRVADRSLMSWAVDLPDDYAA